MILPGDLMANDWNDEECLQFFIEQWRKNWFTSWQYNAANVESFTGADIPAEIRSNTGFMAATMYIWDMFAGAYNYDTQNMNELAAKEVKRADHEGQLCIYLSVLLREMLIKMDVCPPGLLQLVQGYYKHDLREDFPFPMGKRHMGLHCWLLIGDAVLDLSIGQEEKFFDFGNDGPPIIMGRVPAGLELIGFREIPAISSRYARRYSKRAGLAFDAWVARHSIAALDFAKEQMEMMERELWK